MNGDREGEKHLGPSQQAGLQPCDPPVPSAPASSGTHQPLPGAPRQFTGHAITVPTQQEPKQRRRKPFFVNHFPSELCFGLESRPRPGCRGWGALDPHAATASSEGSAARLEAFYFLTQIRIYSRRKMLQGQAPSRQELEQPGHCAHSSGDVASLPVLAPGSCNDRRGLGFPRVKVVRTKMETLMLKPWQRSRRWP